MNPGGGGHTPARIPGCDASGLQNATANHRDASLRFWPGHADVSRSCFFWIAMVIVGSAFLVEPVLS
jgi:hypothetical protein